MKRKVRHLSTMIAIAMFLHLFLHVLSGILLKHISETYYLPFSVVLLLLRYGVPLLFLRFSFRHYKAEPFSHSHSVGAKSLLLVGYSAFFLLYATGALYSAVFSVMQTAPMSTPLDFIIGALLYTALPAILEEIFFRKYIAGYLASFSVFAAVIISALLFGLMHFSAELFPYAFLCGIILAVAYLKTGSLTLVIAAHFGENFLTFIFTVLKSVVKPESLSIGLWIFALTLFLLFLLMLPKLVFLLRSLSLSDEGQQPSADVFTPALLLYFAVSTIRQILFMR